MNAGFRERGRRILRDELAEAAAEYCAEHGVDDVTVDDLARAIGISRATFFRYFHSKEDAVITAVRASRHPLAEAVRGIDAPVGTPAWDVVRTAMIPVIEQNRARPAELRARLAMIANTRSLRAQLAVDRAEERELLAVALSERVTDAASARAAATTAIAAIDLAWHLWAATPGSDFGEQLDRAFALTGAAATVTLEA